MSEDILIETVRGVRTITLNRPERRNAMDAPMEQRYLRALEAANNDVEVRAVVVTGAGTAFCAGADLSALSDLSAGTAGVEAKPLPPYFPLNVGKPLIAAVNGPAVGLGFAEALFCDLRFGSTQARMATAFSRRGLIAEYGTAWLLPRTIGRANALDLLLSGRTVDAEEAAGLGLIDRLVEPEELLPTAQAYAEELATYSSPTSMAIIKEQVALAGSEDLQTALDHSLRLMYESFARADLPEGLRAHSERRPPKFAQWKP